MELKNLLPSRHGNVSWWAFAQTVVPWVLLCVALVWALLHFVHSAPPHTLTITSGPKGSNFESIAQRYGKILARSGIKLNVVPSQGSLENLQRMTDPKSHVDIALVQSGVTTNPDNDDDLESLGGMFYQPLLIFYRSPKPLQRLSELTSQRIAIGPEGSGTRFLALALLKANGIEPGGLTTLTSLEGEAARTALVRKQVDAIFLTGDSASAATLREMIHTDGIRLFEFPQADAYVRRFAYLSKLTLPAGAFDLGENLPPENMSLLAPTVELVAHSNLHPALTDLLIEAATQVHGRASLLQTAGQFPNPSIHTFPISSEAARYYKEGDRSFIYRYLPFWLASLVSRLLIVIVPLFVIIVPSLRYLPLLYRWRIDSRIHHRYGELMELERQTLGTLSEERRKELLDRLAAIEHLVISRRMPGSHAEQVYILREHIDFVRKKLTGDPTPPVHVHRSSQS
ncbi:MAG TPA: TAXI family TRAP transporter solute-binding subunit [Steroidobacteraceae bacterium]